VVLIEFIESLIVVFGKVADQQQRFLFQRFSSFVQVLATGGDYS
jgi:hypothetical protein